MGPLPRAMNLKSDPKLLVGPKLQSQPPTSQGDPERPSGAGVGEQLRSGPWSEGDPLGSPAQCPGSCGGAPGGPGPGASSLPPTPGSPWQRRGRPCLPRPWSSLAWACEAPGCPGCPRRTRVPRSSGWCVEAASFVPRTLEGFLWDANHIGDLASKQRKQGAAHRLGGRECPASGPLGPVVLLAVGFVAQDAIDLVDDGG